MDVATLRPMAATEILDGAFTIYRRHFTTLVVTAFVPILPGLLLIALSRPLGQFVQVLGNVIVMGALVFQASEVAQGRAPQIGASLELGLRRFFPMLLGLLVYTLLVTIGLVALIVPGVCLFCMCFAWEPVIVLENRWAFFSRSRSLARNEWGKISGVMFIAFVIAFLPGLALHLSAMSLLGVSYVVASQSLVVVLGASILGALVAPFSNAVVTLLYYDQRVRKEGLDLQLAVDALGSAGQPAPGMAGPRPSGL